MSNEDKICCWVSWNIFLRIIIFFILLGIPFGLYEFKPITVFQLFSGFGAIIGFYLFYQRNNIFEKQLTQKDDLYIKDSQFKNFLDATKMLTNKDSTIEAKISSLFLLYDVAKSHPENIDRIIQVINKQLTPLINCIETNCYTKRYNKKLVLNEINFYPKSKKEIFQYTINDIVKIDLSNKESRKIIKEWEYKGNDTEKLISISLYILRKLILKILPKIDDHIELSNTIIFDLDTDFDRDLKFYNKKRPTENLIFLNCKLHNVDFKETIYHQASFINCDLKGSDFTKANLWGSLFENSNLEDVDFNQTKCEGIELKKCKNFTKKQLNYMRFAKDDKYTYLIFIDDKTKDNVLSKAIKRCKNIEKYEFKSFESSDTYKEWKQSYKDD